MPLGLDEFTIDAGFSTNHTSRPGLFIWHGDRGALLVCAAHQVETCGCCCLDFGVLNNQLKSRLRSREPVSKENIQEKLQEHILSYFQSPLLEQEYTGDTQGSDIKDFYHVLRQPHGQRFYDLTACTGLLTYGARRNPQYRNLMRPVVFNCIMSTLQLYTPKVHPRLKEKNMKLCLSFTERGHTLDAQLDWVQADKMYTRAIIANSNVQQVYSSRCYAPPPHHDKCAVSCVCVCDTMSRVCVTLCDVCDTGACVMPCNVCDAGQRCGRCKGRCTRRSMTPTWR